MEGRKNCRIKEVNVSVCVFDLQSLKITDTRSLLSPIPFNFINH